jgi:Ca2+:H+ antiporter
MSAVFLAIPTIFYLGLKTPVSVGADKLDSFGTYSVIASALVLLFYILSFVYQFGTGRSLYVREASEEILPPAGEKKPVPVLVIALLIVSLPLVGVSENLVESLELMVEGAHLNPLFVGLFLLPLFGCFSEALISIKAATSNRMELAMASTVESSVQLMLFVLPVLVLCGVPLGRFLHLAIPGTTLFCLGATVLTVHWIIENKKLSWLEGSLLLVLYSIIGAGTLFLGGA